MGKIAVVILLGCSRETLYKFTYIDRSVGIYLEALVPSEIAIIRSKLNLNLACQSHFPAQ